ncbi:MAG: histidine kinase, partial [Chloroflexi bacterium]|nr:histidine kinase [Chloroflexota bacterium]
QAKAARLIEEGQVNGSVVVMRDISQLHEVDRMKDKFISTVSHELRTPLANLKLYLSLLQQGRPERYPMYVEVMEREIERLARLISDLLDISRMQGEQNAERRQIREIVNIENLTESAVHQHMAWADKERKELLYECLSSPLPTTYGDPSQLIRALNNLISNAITYTPEGGRIVVHCWAESARQNGSELIIIEVSDTGIGIPAQELKTIFERFYRGMNVSPNIPGTGLGLAILKEIMDLHGGNIEVESQEGRGSTFRLRLPVIHNKPS